MNQNKKKRIFAAGLDKLGFIEARGSSYRPLINRRRGRYRYSSVAPTGRPTYIGMESKSVAHKSAASMPHFPPAATLTPHRVSWPKVLLTAKTYANDPLKPALSDCFLHREGCKRRFWLKLVVHARP